MNKITSRTLPDFITQRYDRAIGFDRVFNQMFSGVPTETTTGYPPYDIMQYGDNSYKIKLAVAGMNINDIEITQHKNELMVVGTPKEVDTSDDSSIVYLHQGIARRKFERRFVLADHVTVIGAKLNDGILTIGLQREVPDELKPRTIAIEFTK